MVYGRSQYWYSWTGRIEDQPRDLLERLGVHPTRRRSARPPSRHAGRKHSRCRAPCSVLLRGRRSSASEVSRGPSRTAIPTNRCTRSSSSRRRVRIRAMLGEVPAAARFAAGAVEEARERATGTGGVCWSGSGYVETEWPRETPACELCSASSCRKSGTARHLGWAACSEGSQARGGKRPQAVGFPPVPWTSSEGFGTSPAGSPGPGQVRCGDLRAPQAHSAAAGASTGGFRSIATTSRRSSADARPTFAAG